VLKGMVVYNGGHYMTYIRNLKTKIAFVIDARKEYTEMLQINGELSKDTEWTLYNDCTVSSVTGNWKEIVRACLSSRCQPTVLMYEKLGEDDH
jgi:hypothetical protein